MTDSISFGKGKKAGKIDLAKVKDGLTKEQIAGKNKKLQSIFDKVDTSGNGILEQDELLAFKEELEQLAGEDNQLTDKEAKGFTDIKGKQMKRGRRKAFYEFLNKLAANEQEVSQAPQPTADTQEPPTTDTQEPPTTNQPVANPGDIIVEENDGIEEEFEIIQLPDGSIKKAPYSKTENKGLPNETTTFYNCDANGNVTQTNTTVDGKQVTTFYGEGVEYDKLDETKPEKQIIIDNDNYTATVTTYNEKGNKVEAVYSNVSAEIDEDGKLHVSSFAGEEKTITFNEYNDSGKKLAQTVEKNGKKYDVSYDGEGNTHIVVQYKETPEAIAKKFNCDVNKLIELNGGDRRIFTTGAIVKIPDELDADSAVLQKRGTRKQELIKQQNANNKKTNNENLSRIRKRTQAECNAREVISYTIEDQLVYSKAKGCWTSVYSYDIKTDKGIIHYLYRQEGQSQATESSFNARLKQLRDLNPGRFDKSGRLIDRDKPLNLPVSPELAQKWGAEVTRNNDRKIMYTESDNATTGKRIAKDAYKAIKGLSTDVPALTKAVNSLNQNNIVGFLSSYNDSYGESFIKAIRGESAIKGNKEEANYLAKVKYSLIARSKALGLDHTDLLNSITTKTSTKDIETILNRVLSEIRSIEVLAPSERAAAIAEMKGELTHDDVKGVRDAGDANKKEADKILENQLKQDGFFGDLYEGLKWCVRSKQLDEKVRADINGFQKKLNAVVTKYNQTHDLEAFKAEFRAQFGVDCDPQLIKQYTNLTAKIQISQQLDFVEAYFENHERMSETQLRKLFANLQKTDPNFLGKDVDINKLSKQDMNNIINSVVNSLRSRRGNSISSTSELVNARQAISRQLFGAKNDVIFRSMDYADSQRQGAAYLKMGTKIVAAIIGGIFTGGIGGAAIVAGATSLAADVGDAEYRAFVNDGEHMSLDEFETAATEALVNAGMTYLGGSYYKALEGLTNLSKLAKAGMLTTLDITSGAVVEKVMTGEITIEGTVFTALFSAAGHCIGLKPKGKGAGKNQQTTTKPVADNETPVLSNAVKQQNGDGSVKVADPSSVRVGETKAENITAEIDGLVTRENVTAQDLAKARRELNGISDSKLRENLRSRLDEKGNNIPGYKEQVRADQKALAEQIADKHEITPGDARAVKEYVENTTNIAELEELMGRFDIRKPGHAPTRDIIENRINVLKQNARSADQIQTEVHKELDNAIANNKGLPSVKDLNTHLNSTTDLSELNQLFDKWMKIRKNCGSSDRKKIDTLFKQKGFDITRPNQRQTQPEVKGPANKSDPVAPHDEPVTPSKELEGVVNADPAEPVAKVEEQPVIQHDEPVIPAEEPKVGVITEEVPTPENIIHDAQVIPEAEIPAEQRNLWKSCQERINKIFSTGQELVLGEVRTVLADLKTFYNAVKNIEVKKQIANLSKKIQTFAKSKISNNAPVGADISITPAHPNAQSGYKLSASQRKIMMDKFEIFHEKFSDINYLRKKYPQYSNLSDTELLAKFALNEDHAAFVMNRKDLFGNGKYGERAYWNDSPFEQTNNHSAWKMHLFSVDTQDYQQMAEIILPYLNKNKIAHKTLSSTMSPELLATSVAEQTGKAFTIYPQSQAEMEMIARDLDMLIRQNNLTTGNSHITGDNQLGNSGRLFYRYEYPTGKMKDKIFTPEEYDRTPRDVKYDSNRGEGNYLASDMTAADDPWLNFDPSNPNSKPGQTAPAPKTPTAAPRGKSPEERVIANQIIGDIQNAKTPQAIDAIQAKIDRLPESSPYKTELQRQLREKGREINNRGMVLGGAADPANNPTPGRTPEPAKPANSTSSTAANWQMSADNRSHGFQRNMHAETNITALTPNEVSVSGNATGYSHFAGPTAKNLGVNPDFKSGFTNTIQKGQAYSVYNAEANVTAIGVLNNDTFSRPGLFQILVKGQVSEADATALMQILKDKNLIPNMKDGLTPEVQAKAKQIQEVTAEYFNNKNTIEADPYFVDVSEQAEIIAEPVPEGHTYEVNENGDLIAIAEDKVIWLESDVITIREPREIHSSIDRASTEVEFNTLQKDIDALPDGPEKRALQEKLNKKRQEYNNAFVLEDEAELSSASHRDQNDYYNSANDPANYLWDPSADINHFGEYDGGVPDFF